MRQSKYSETQIVSILKQADAGCPLNDIWRTYGISSALQSYNKERAHDALAGLPTAMYRAHLEARSSPLAVSR